MIKNLNKVNPTSICIISGGCNLQCKYCNIDKSKNTSQYTDFLSDSIKSIENGLYLKNYKKAFRRLKASPKEITRFEIWGQEPTLLLKSLNEKWHEWYNYFPNLDTISFSTNGVGFTDDIYNFILKINEYATKEITVSIQYSYDGEYGEDKARGFNKHELIINNLTNLILKLNDNNDLKKIKISFNLHGVISTQLIDYLDSLEKVDIYLTELSNTADKIKSLIIKNNVLFYEADIVIQNCDYFTTEDGLKLKKFCSLVNYLNKNKKYSLLHHWSDRPIEAVIFGTMTKDVISMFKGLGINNLDDLVNYFLANEYLPTYCMCGSITGYIKMDHNGYLLDCHGSMYDPYIDSAKIDNSVFHQARLTCQRNGRYVNIITDSDEDVEKIIDFYENTHNSSTLLFMFNNILNTMYLMASLNQIDSSYLTDFNKMKRHAFILARFNQCFHGLKLMTGSIYFRGNEELRQIFNGVMDNIENIINYEINYIVKNKLIITYNN